MAANTKERSETIQTAARVLLIERNIDIMQQVDMRSLAKELAKQAQCHPDTAWRHIGTAVRRARGEHTAQWGGDRRSEAFTETIPIRISVEAAAQLQQLMLRDTSGVGTPEQMVEYLIKQALAD